MNTRERAIEAVCRAFKDLDLDVGDEGAAALDAIESAGLRVIEAASPEDVTPWKGPRHSEPHTANVRETFDYFIGQRLTGVMHDADRRVAVSTTSVTRLLRFESGLGLEISSNGSFWPVSAEDVEKRFRKRREELEAQLKSVTGELARLP